MATWNGESAESGGEYYPPTFSDDNQLIASNWQIPSSDHVLYRNSRPTNVSNFPDSYENYDASLNTFEGRQENYVGFQQFINQFQNSSIGSNEMVNSGLSTESSIAPVSSNLTPTATEFVPRYIANYPTQYDVESTETQCEMNYCSVGEDANYNISDQGISNPESRGWWKQINPDTKQNENLDKSNTMQSDTSSKWKSIKNNMHVEASHVAKPQQRNNEQRNKFRNQTQNRYSDKNINFTDDASFYGSNASDKRRAWDSKSSQSNNQKRGDGHYNNDSHLNQNGRSRFDKRFNDDTKYCSYSSEGPRTNRDFSNRAFSKKDKTRYETNYRSRNTRWVDNQHNSQTKYEAKCLDKDKADQHASATKRSNKNCTYNETIKIEQDSQGSQRERLTLALDRGTLECLVCCERVKPYESIWSCPGCYHVLHLACIVKWASTSKADNGWRCPACQRLCTKVPSDYQCFCRKTDKPRYNRHESAHSCGQICGRPGAPPCVHSCTLLCHPGPCPPCQAQVARQCGCTRSTRIIQCSQIEVLLCDSVCDKELNCGQHKCQKQCHEGPCPDCEQKIIQECYCGKATKEVACDAESAMVQKYTCESLCEATLNCGKHKCQELCHNGDCKPCMLDPERVTACPCGKMPLPEGSRISCLDPVPVCGGICGKLLTCGAPGSPHTCSQPCHEGPCPVCPLETLVRCRCGHMDREMQCSLLTTRANDARCQKKCTKKRDCGRHKCNALCCIALDHPCPLPCSHTLSCGLHRCDRDCHRGRCQPCWRSSFEELSCECGTSIRHPPVPCGARRPPCDRLCSRQHACEHPVLHTCHSDPECPPCTVLCNKWCHGKHEMRKTIPCHQEDFSCGKPCGRALPCGRHKCQLPCHKGVCLREGQLCVQPCNTIRSTCGHACKVPCHDGACPDSPCKEMVKVTCQCKHRSTTRACADTTRDYQRIATAMLASKMADMQRGETIDIQDIVGNRGCANLKTLECTDDCRLVERNRRMTVGLQIRNPDLSNKLNPRYSDFLKQWAKRDPSFVQNIHDKLTELVRLAKQSKQKFRSYSFPVMNREKRQVVHEMCEQFGIEGEAYDAEPNRNVVATADKEKSWLPSMSLLEVIQRESGQRKVPVPSMSMRTSRTN